MIFAASGTMQCACTSTVLMRLPAITTSQRRCSWAWTCPCPAEPPPALALAPALTEAVNSQPVNMIPLFWSLTAISAFPSCTRPACSSAAEPTPGGGRMPTQLVVAGPAPVGRAGDHRKPQQPGGGLKPPGGNDESGPALPYWSIGVRERDLDDAPDVKARHRRLCRPRMTIHRTPRTDRRPDRAVLLSRRRDHPRSDRPARRPRRGATPGGPAAVSWSAPCWSVCW